YFSRVWSSDLCSSDLDFKHKSLDGLGDDWPIGYNDVKPYYDKVDQLIGVFGSIENMPDEPDGIFLPPPKPRLLELYYKKAGNKRTEDRRVRKVSSYRG